MKSKNSQTSSTGNSDTTKFEWLDKIFFIKADGPSSNHAILPFSTEKGSFIIRIGSGESGFYNILLEIYLQPILMPVVPVAKLIDSGTLAQSQDLYFQVFHKTTGSSVHDMVQEAEQLLIIRSFGIHLRRLHSLSAQGTGPLDLKALKQHTIKGIHNSWNQFLNLRLADHCRQLVLAKILHESEIGKVSSVLEKKIPEPEPVLLHGDAANHNVMGKNGQVTAILDWEAALSGDPLYDVAFYATGAVDHPHWLAAFFEGYFGSSNLPKQYEDRFNYYYLRISLAKAVSRLREQKSEPGLPDLRSRILLALSRMR